MINPTYSKCGDFNEGLAPVEVNGKWGFIDANGISVVPPMYDEVESFNNELARVDLLSPLNELIGYTDYNFLNGRIKSLTLYLTNGGLSSPWLKQLYNYDANGNIIKTNLFVNDFINDQLAPAGFIDFEYDGHINPQSPVRDFMLLIWQAVSANNVKKEVHVDQFGNTEETLVYTYTYNSRNLPARATVQRTIPGNPVETLEMLFSYWP